MQTNPNINAERIKGHLELDAGTVSSAPLRLNIGTDTTVPNIGDIMFNGDVLKIKTTLVTKTVAFLSKRKNIIVSSLTPTFNVDTHDELHITALAGNITSMTTNLTGTLLEGRKIIFTFEDNGIARTITWGALFISMLATLPTTTIVGKKLIVGLKYNSTSGLFECWAASYNV